MKSNSIFDNNKGKHSENGQNRRDLLKGAKNNQQTLGAGENFFNQIQYLMIPM